MASISTSSTLPPSSPLPSPLPLPLPSPPLPSSIETLLSGLPSSAQEVYRYWYRGNPHDDGYEHDTALWFRGGPMVDAHIKTKFESTWQSLSSNHGENDTLKEWIATPRGIVCAIIVLDQMARNMFRGTKGMFGTDDIAIRIALAATQPSTPTPTSVESTTATTTTTTVTPLARVGLLGLAAAEELFIWMTLEHSETLSIVEHAVDGLQSLMLTCHRLQRGAIQRMHRVATQHYEVLKVWGRYPHRNEVLARKSTDDEVYH
jgi:uncharacterized protein (DUF924 family)